MNRGEIWLATLDPVRGSEQAGTRPVLVVQQNALNAFLRTVVIIPLTSNTRWARFPFCVSIPADPAGRIQEGEESAPTSPASLGAAPLPAGQDDLELNQPVSC